jgi:hypothetical protein
MCLLGVLPAGAPWPQFPNGSCRFPNSAREMGSGSSASRVRRHARRSVPGCLVKGNRAPVSTSAHPTRVGPRRRAAMPVAGGGGCTAGAVSPGNRFALRIARQAGRPASSAGRDVQDRIPDPLESKPLEIAHVGGGQIGHPVMDEGQGDPGIEDPSPSESALSGEPSDPIHDRRALD